METFKELLDWSKGFEMEVCSGYTSARNNTSKLKDIIMTDDFEVHIFHSVFNGLSHSSWISFVDKNSKSHNHEDVIGFTIIFHLYEGRLEVISVDQGIYKKSNGSLEDNISGFQRNQITCKSWNKIKKWLLKFQG